MTLELFGLGKKLGLATAHQSDQIHVFYEIQRIVLQRQCLPFWLFLI